MLLNAMDLVGRFRFSGITSDNTGNVRVARQLVCQTVKTIIPMSDVCHHLNLLCKDIAKLPMFKNMITQLRSIVTYFRKSTQASDALQQARLQRGITRGIEGIGKTRFATICAASISVQRCLPAIRDIVISGAVKFPGKKGELASLFKTGSARGMTFELELNRFINIEGPIAKAIICLESSQTNPADVYKYWLAICGCIKEIFEDPSTGFSVEEMGQIYAIVNARFREQLRDGPADCYLAALCLDPRYVRSAILHNPLSLKIKLPHVSDASKKIDSTQAAATHDDAVLKSPTYQRVVKYLKTVLEAEFKSQHNPILKGKMAPFVREAFIRQFEHYVKGQYPFDTPLEEGQDTLSYWNHLTKITEGSVLACIAQKLYSIKPSSMPEERTMSVFTKMNTPARNRQQVRTLVDMTQIRQWHM
ncbi:hypothetical protein M405DRAFT_778782, partial [Rhizopogon salebrosus TDB-379]